MNNEQNTFENIDSESPLPVETPERKTMSPAAIAANRANAKHSTGPRTQVGKLKAASNSLKHGLYSMKNFDHFVHDHDIALAVETNFIEQFNPVTPTEVTLVHQLVHMQLRFLQMEYLYGQAMRFRVEDILANPVSLLPAIMRELDRLPSRIQRTIKVLRAEIAHRESFIGHGENVEIKAIADAPPLPGRPANEVYYGVATEKGHIPIEKLPGVKRLAETDPDAAVALAQKIINDFTDRMAAKHAQASPPVAQKS